MIRVAIVEDEQDYVNTLTEYLKKYEKEHDVFFDIRTFSDGLDIAEDYTADHDIILLDIQMKHMDGMRAAQLIREKDESVVIIFITSTVQFAVQGYTVGALGYIVKPVTYMSFANIMHKATGIAAKSHEQRSMSIKTDNGFRKVAIDSIFYIESQRHDIILHTTSGEFTTDGPMKKVEEMLVPLGFSKCHNAYLVNLQHVTGIVQNDVQLSDGHLLPISRARKKPFMDDLTNHIGGSQ